MTTCVKCGTERTLGGYCGAQGQQEDACALRAELRDAQNAIDGLVALSGKKEQALRDLRAAVLAVAEKVHAASHSGWATSELTCEKWARALREAVEK